MTIAVDDLRAAVSAGILNEAQAAGLKSLSDSRRGARENLSPGDEPFELFKGFNEIFIVVGLVILAMGWMGVSAFYVSRDIGDTVWRITQMSMLGAGVLWALSEYFIRRRRMIAPAITLSIFFGVNAAIGLVASFAEPFMIGSEDYASLPLPIALTVVALGVYWLRFRVPFAMAMIAVGLFVTAMVVAAAQAGTPRDISDLFLLSAGGPFAWITLVLGILVFIVAMLFDMSDPHRVTRRAANGFWLHLVAAPALVNTVALTLLSRESSGSNTALLVFLSVIALVAIVIDRRSFLIAGVGYCVTLASTVFDVQGSTFTILFLGVVLLILGAFWEKIRAGLLRMMPFLPLNRLPPSI